jgi:hypothetical protein
MNGGTGRGSYFKIHNMNFMVLISVSDPYWFYADPDPDPAFLLNADPDPDPTCGI